MFLVLVSLLFLVGCKERLEGTCDSKTPCTEIYEGSYCRQIAGVWGWYALSEIVCDASNIGQEVYCQDKETVCFLIS